MSGAESGSVSISKGWGDLAKDGWNVLASFAHDEQTELRSTQRDFSASGIHPFAWGGQQYYLYQTSVNSVPANVQLIDGSGNLVGYFSPYQAANGGKCPQVTFANGARCRFDYPANVEDVAPARRTTGYIDAHYKINEKTTAWIDVLLSQYDMIPRYAPPAQPLLLTVGGALYNKDILPLITAGKVVNATTGATLATTDLTAGSYGIMNLRLYDAGGRTDDYGTNTKHIAAGVDGNAFGWDYKAAYVHSYTGYSDTAKGGYVSNVGLNALVAAGKFDPLMNTAGTADLSSIILRDRLDLQRTFLDTVSLDGNRDLFTLPGGAAAVGTGISWSHTRQTDDPSQILQTANAFQPTYPDSIVGGGAGNLPYEAGRSNFGAYAEIGLPVAKSFEATIDLRFDSYGKVKNSLGYGGLDSNGFTIPVGAQDQGVSSSKGTYKVQFKFTPITELALRGSYGTGFRAPRVFDIANPLSFAGNTAGSYNCPFTAPNPLAAGCQPPGSQYDVLAGGNPGSGSSALKPETSKQYTLGMVFEPTKNISAIIDFWNVKINDQISAIPEAVAFLNPSTYSYLFKVINDPIAQVPYLAFISAPINLTQSQYRGIDYDIRWGKDLSFGRVTGEISGTHLLKAEYQIPGLDGWQTSLGQYGPDQTVAFRDIIHLSATADVGAFSHTITANYKSGYHDESFTAGQAAIRVATSTGGLGGYVDFAGIDVKSYTLWDWQSVYHASKSWDMTLGIRNLFDHRPPFSAVIAGGGNQVGYDGRYADPTLRTVYARLKYVF